MWRWAAQMARPGSGWKAAPSSQTLTVSRGSPELVTEIGGHNWASHGMGACWSGEEQSSFQSWAGCGFAGPPSWCSPSVCSPVSSPFLSR